MYTHMYMHMYMYYIYVLYVCICVGERSPETKYKGSTAGGGSRVKSLPTTNEDASVSLVIHGLISHAYLHLFLYVVDWTWQGG